MRTHQSLVTYWMTGTNWTGIKTKSWTISLELYVFSLSKKTERAK